MHSLVLLHRTTRITLVLELPYDMHNVMAVMRTMECLGIQNLYIVKNAVAKNTTGGESISRVRSFDR